MVQPATVKAPLASAHEADVLSLIETLTALTPEPPVSAAVPVSAPVQLGPLYAFALGKLIVPVAFVTSLVSVSVVPAFELPATSVPVTVSVGALPVGLLHVNGFETYGPPLGVDTVEEEKRKPVEEPPSAPNRLEAGRRWRR